MVVSFRRWSGGPPHARRLERTHLPVPGAARVPPSARSSRPTDGSAYGRFDRGNHGCKPALRDAWRGGFPQGCRWVAIGSAWARRHGRNPREQLRGAGVDGGVDRAGQRGSIGDAAGWGAEQRGGGVFDTEASGTISSPGTAFDMCAILVGGLATTGSTRPARTRAARAWDQSAAWTQMALAATAAGGQLSASMTVHKTGLRRRRYLAACQDAD